MKDYKEIVENTNPEDVDLDGIYPYEYDDSHKFIAIGDELDFNFFGQYELFGFTFGNFTLGWIIGGILIFSTVIILNWKGFKEGIKDIAVKIIQQSKSIFNYYLNNKGEILFLPFKAAGALIIGAFALKIMVVVYSAMIILITSPFIILGGKLIETDYEIKEKWYKSIVYLADWCGKNSTNRNLDCITGKRVNLLKDSTYILEEINFENSHNEEVYRDKKEVYSEYIKTAKKPSIGGLNSLKKNTFHTLRSFAYLNNEYFDENIDEKTRFIAEYVLNFPKIENLSRADYSTLYKGKDRYSEDNIKFALGKLKHEDIYYINRLCYERTCMMDIQFDSSNGYNVVEKFYIHPFVKPKTLVMSDDFFKDEGLGYLIKLSEVEKYTYSKILELEKEYDMPEFILRVKNSIEFKPTSAAK